LTADTAPTGIIAGQFAIIDNGNYGTDSENSRLYLWNGTSYQYVSDLSGAQGIQGPQGPQGTSANVAVYNQGNLITSSASSINFVGAGIDANISGTNVVVSVTSTGSSLSIYDEGNLLTTSASIIKFSGPGITANIDAGNITVTVNATATSSATIDGFSGALVPSIFDSFTANGSTTQFVLSATILSARDILVTVDSVIQSPITNYTVASDILTFTDAPAANSAITVRSFGNYTSRDGFVDRFTGNGAANSYVLSGQILSTNSLIAFVDGVYQIPEVDFTVSGQTITFVGAAIDSNVDIVVQSFNNTLGSGPIVADPPKVLVSNTAAVRVDSFTSSQYRTAKYIISVSASQAYQATEAMVVHDGNTAIVVTYATVYTGSLLMNFAANIVAGQVVLWGTGVNSYNEVKTQKTYIKV